MVNYYIPTRLIFSPVGAVANRAYRDRQFGATSTAPHQKRTTHVRNQPAFIQADTHIRLHSDVTATLPPRLCAVSRSRVGLMLRRSCALPPPLTIRPLTLAILGWKALWGEGSPLNSHLKTARHCRATLGSHTRTATPLGLLLQVPSKGLFALHSPLEIQHLQALFRRNFSSYLHQKAGVPGCGGPALLSALARLLERKFGSLSAGQRGCAAAVLS